MPSPRTSKRNLLEERLKTLRVIDENTWEQLKLDLAPISNSYLRSLLKHSGHQLTPLVEGVNISTLDDADRTLRALAAEYEAADLPRRKQCRALVIESKQRIRWWLSRAGLAQTEARADKEEILLWVSTWLENPALFADWSSLRRRLTLTAARKTPP